MAETIVFGADIDNVTIKVVDNKLTAVGGSNAENEFEVVTNYVDPVEDDEFYVESTEAKILHKPTQLLLDAHKKEKKPRSAPVDESLVEPLVAEVVRSGDEISLRVPRKNYTSTVDGASLSHSAIDPTETTVAINKTDYANAKAYNEATAGKTFSVTTEKRYATSEGHPMVRPTELHVQYPTMAYIERTETPEVDNESAEIVIGLQLYSVSEEEAPTLRELNDIGNAASHRANYTLKTRDNQTFTGTHEFTGYRFDRRELTEFANNMGDFVYEKWEIEPFVVESFNGKVTVNPKLFERNY